jgi:hypothetical protein
MEISDSAPGRGNDDPTPSQTKGLDFLSDREMKNTLDSETGLVE